MNKLARGCSTYYSKVLFVCVMFLFSFSNSNAAEIFSDNFNSNYNGWTASNGNGSVSSSSWYYGINPKSVRLKGSASITRTISTVNYENISIDWNILASRLENTESCQLQINTGSGWVTVAEVSNGEDDGSYRSGTATLGAVADDNANFMVRVRGSQSNEWSDYCYTDDFVLNGDQVGSGGRTHVTYDELIDNEYKPSSIVDDTHFGRPSDAADSLHVFEGRITLTSESSEGGYYSYLQDDIGDDFSYLKHIPEFLFDFVEDSNGNLIPKQRGLIVTDHGVFNESGWNYILGPGKTWSEPGDNGWSRASFPFTLNQKAANCTHNGVMMFLYNDSSISNVRYQITQETCIYHIVDMWGQLAASRNTNVAGANAIKSDFAQELADRIPTKPFTDLAIDYPGVDPSEFAKNVPFVTTKGLYYNGVNYVGSCDTHTGAGQYPYCDYMVFASFSTAKTAFAGTAMLALAQSYGDDAVFDAKIADYLFTAYPGGGAWADVTFDHTIDMVTGNYTDNGFFVDEAGATSINFFTYLYDLDKFYPAFEFPSKVAPGTEWVYHTTDTFIATQAMTYFLQSKTLNTNEDIWDWMVSNVYAPLKMSPESLSTLRSRAGSFANPTDPTGRNNGYPFGGYGMFWTQDNIAKMGRFILTDEGKINGNQILHSGRLADSLMQTNDTKYATGGNAGSDEYNNSLWSRTLSVPPIGGSSGCTVKVPHMKGFGGITVALMPNGAVYYVFSDGFVNDYTASFNFDKAIQESHKISSHCDGF